MLRDSEEDAELSRRFSRRAMLLGLGQIAAFGVLGGRLYQLQVMEGARYAPLADDNRRSVRLITPVRGRILDRSGIVLAANEELFRVLVNPAEVSDMRAMLALLTRIVPVSTDVQNQLVGKSGGRPRTAPIVVASDVTFEQLAEINLLAPQLAGVETEIAYVRKYPLGDRLGHVTGHLGVVERRALDDDAALRSPGIRIGKAGIELGMDRELRGVAGARRFEVDARGRTVRPLEETAAQPGSDVVTSIDVRLQNAAMERLGSEKRAAAVVIAVATGEVVVMASVPTFDPNDVTGQVPPATWRRIAEGEHQPMLNRAISGLYPPGSTLKMVTALAGLEAGVITPKDKIRCNGSFTLANQTYRCWHRRGHGRVDLREAIKESCDVYFYEVAKRTGIRPLAEMCRRFGLGEDHVVGLELEKPGVVPDADWKRWKLREGWSTGDTILTGIGQGYVLATPVQLAVMGARVACGAAVVPSVVRALPGAEQSAFPSLGIRPEYLGAVREALVACVNERRGTGTAARVNDVKVAGKTGTSQVRRAADDGEDESKLDWELRDHALFVAYYPAEAPRYAISVVVEHGGSGGASAAPIVKDIIEALRADDPAARTYPATSPDTSRAAGAPADAERG